MQSLLVLVLIPQSEKQLIQPGEECIEIIVDIITLLSVAKFDLTTHSILLELIKDRTSPEYASLSLSQGYDLERATHCLPFLPKLQ